MAEAGYSGTPLPRKLGLKDGQRVAFVGLPATLANLAEACRFAQVTRTEDWRALPSGLDLVHFFTDAAQQLAEALPELTTRIVDAGVIWVSWPKKASGVPTDVTEDVIRAEALAGPLVDVKVCAVDDIWSGLKLVIRKELRGQAA